MRVSRQCERGYGSESAGSWPRTDEGKPCWKRSLPFLTARRTLDLSSIVSRGRSRPILNDVIRRNLALARTKLFAYHPLSPAYHPVSYSGRLRCYESPDRA